MERDPFFQALVRGVNKAWGTHEYSWWRLPIKNLAWSPILASALLLGVIAPALLNQMEYVYLRAHLKYAEVHLATVKAAPRPAKPLPRRSPRRKRTSKPCAMDWKRSARIRGLGPLTIPPLSFQTIPSRLPKDCARSIAAPEFRF